MLSQIGNTSTSVYGEIANEGRVLGSYTIVNKTSVPVNANLAIRRSNVNINIIPKDTPIYGNMMYPNGFQPIPIGMNANDQVVLIVTGNVDYSFTYLKPDK